MLRIAVAASDWLRIACIQLKVLYLLISRMRIFPHFTMSGKKNIVLDLSTRLGGGGMDNCCSYCCPSPSAPPSIISPICLCSPPPAPALPLPLTLCLQLCPLPAWGMEHMISLAPTAAVTATAAQAVALGPKLELLVMHSRDGDVLCALS